MVLVRQHVWISGKVQGVCFRAYTEQEAQRLGLQGWVRNLPDGRVEGVFEGEEELPIPLNCSVCHGKEGIPLMTGAFDFRNKDAIDTTKMPDHVEAPLKDWPDSLWYRRVTRGVDTTPMSPWGMAVPHLYLWRAEAYARTFHDPIEKRKEKRPIPPIPTKDDIERWKTEKLFLDPLL